MFWFKRLLYCEALVKTFDPITFQKVIKKMCAIQGKKLDVVLC